METMELTLPAAPTAATTARCEVTRRFSPRLAVSALEDVRLLLTELVTNAVRHSDVDPQDEIDVKAELSGETVRIEVHDPGRNGPVEVRTPGARGGGYGLFLVDKLTQRWGVERDGGTTVWAELAAGPAR
jgi:serine/threonine-protein kinase RsbW